MIDKILCPYCRKFMLGKSRLHQNCDLNKLLLQATGGVQTAYENSLGTAGSYTVAAKATRVIKSCTNIDQIPAARAYVLMVIKIILDKARHTPVGASMSAKRLKFLLEQKAESLKT